MSSTGVSVGSTSSVVPLGIQRRDITLAGGGRVMFVRLRRSVMNQVMQLAGLDGSVGGKVRFAELIVRAAVVSAEGVTDPFTAAPLWGGKLHKAAVGDGLELCGQELIDCLTPQEVAEIHAWVTTGAVPEAAAGKSATPPGGSTGGGSGDAPSSTGAPAPSAPAPNA